MCWQCAHVKKEIGRLTAHLEKMQVSLHTRKDYYRSYYRANREKKIEAAKARYRATRSQAHNDSAVCD